MENSAAALCNLRATKAKARSGVATKELDHGSGRLMSFCPLLIATADPLQAETSHIRTRLPAHKSAQQQRQQHRTGEPPKSVKRRGEDSRVAACAAVAARRCIAQPHRWTLCLKQASTTTTTTATTCQRSRARDIRSERKRSLRQVWTHTRAHNWHRHDQYTAQQASMCANEWPDQQVAVIGVFDVIDSHSISIV